MTLGGMLHGCWRKNNRDLRADPFKARYQVRTTTRNAGMKIHARSNLPQERGERVDCQLAGVVGGWRQASDFANQLFPAHLPGFVQTFALDQFGDGRSAGHRRNTAFGAKTNFGDARAFRFRLFQSKAEFENVSADGIFELRDGVGRFQFTGVSRVLKMVEKIGGIHMAIVMRWPGIS
jgi:hypothetical protein